MDNRYNENLINEMAPFLEEHSFTKINEGIYSNDTKSLKINYDESRQMYTLSVADIEEGITGDYKEINSWLFDDSQTGKDAASVGIDFVASLRKNMGIKLKRNVSADSIDLPSSNKSGSMTISGFTKKALDVFPTLKDDYKTHMTQYGDFLYMTFYGEHLIPQLKTLLTSSTKKQTKKFYDLFEDAYVKGDRETVNIVVAILCAASYNNEDVHTSINNMLADDKHFYTAYNSFLPVFSKNKKLISILIKH